MSCRLLLMAAVLCTGCLDFDERLESCRDGGVWICTGGDGGATDAGAEDAGDEGLLCTGAWCWDHPRPTGVRLQAVWGTGTNDLWVGGDRGTLLHFDGAKWASHSQNIRLDFTSICGHGAKVYFGAGTSEAPQLNRLFVWDGASLSEVDGSKEDINQLACGAQSLWVARDWGTSRLDWGSSSLVSQFTLQGFDEKCMGVAESSGGEVVAACMSAGTGLPFVRMRSGDGGLEHELIDTGGTHGTSFGVRGMWTDPSRGVLAGITGVRGEIWQRDAAWAPLWSSTTAGNTDIYAGAAHTNGSLAVGVGGTVVDITSTTVSDQVVASAGNSYHLGVWAEPSGNAWVVGERGCILARDAGVWTQRPECIVGFEDFALEPEFAAVNYDGLYRRGATGWVFTKRLGPEQIALWENPDGGGFAFLSRTRLQVNDDVLPVSLFDDATQMQVVSEDRVVIVRASGVLIDTNLHDGASLTFDAGVRIFSLSSEPDGTLWAAGENGTVLRSTTPGAWAPENIGLSGDIVELVTGFGRQWAISGNLLATRPVGGTWTQRALSEGAFERVVPLNADSVLLLRDTSAAIRVTSTFVVRSVEPPPTRLYGRILLRGGELWGVGLEGGLIRYRLP